MQYRDSARLDSSQVTSSGGGGAGGKLAVGGVGGIIIVLLAMFLGFLIGFGGRLPAAEPWSDSRLRETNGLAIWFDVSRQNAARGLAQLAPLKSWADAADYLFDGSGNGRHIFQPLRGRRPRFKQEIEGAVLNFDSEGRAMGTVGLGLRFTNLTVFVVAIVFQPLPALRCSCTSLGARLGLKRPPMRPLRLALMSVATNCAICG